MGEQVTDTTSIAAPMDTVWEVIVDLAAYPEWADGVLATEVLSSNSAGYPRRARFRIDAKVVEVAYTIEYQYTGYDVGWHLVEGDTINQLDGAYSLWEEDGGGTGVRYSLEVDVDLPLPGFLKKRAARTILEQGLTGLKARAEGLA